MTNGTDTVSFLYDAEGKRISKSDGTNTFEYFYAEGKLTRIKRNNTTLHFDYDMLGPSVIRYNGVDYYYHRNAQGDIDGISNQSGDLVASYHYDAWGKPISVTGTMATTIGVLNPFRYRGYLYDQETGLYYLNTRYYDPEIGRFISPDSVSYLGADGTVLGYDLYTYCDNDPVNKVDSNGDLPVWVFAKLHRAVLEAIQGENPALNLIIDKTTIRYGKQVIFCDIYSANTKEVWELKHRLVSTNAAKRQLERYVNGTIIINGEKTQLHLPKYTTIPEGHTSCIVDGKLYQLHYRDAGEGILRYEIESPQIRFSADRKAVAVGAGIVGLGIMGCYSQSTGGYSRGHFGGGGIMCLSFVYK